MMIPIKDYKITSPYGYRILRGKKEFHDGIDFISVTGDKNVYAIANGIVEYDMDNYDDYTMLPIPPEWEWDIIKEVYAMYSTQAIADKVVDATQNELLRIPVNDQRQPE